MKCCRGRVSQNIGTEQFGFRQGLGTRDTIETLRVLTESSIQNGQDVYICFVDNEKYLIE